MSGNGTPSSPAQRSRAKTPTRACLDLGDRLDAAPAGRRFVRREVLSRGGAEIVDDAVLVAAELLANACQHGTPPIRVCVSGLAPQLRIDVYDASARIPLRLASSPDAMTGRGVSIVETLATRWGAEHVDSEGNAVGAGRAGSAGSAVSAVSDPNTAGKRVWAEFDTREVSTQSPPTQAHVLFDAWTAVQLPSTEERFPVVLGDVPTLFLIEAKAHIDNLVREFLLASAGGRSGGAQVPEHLARLIETVVHGFGDARDAIKRQALAAAAAGAVTTRLTLYLPTSAARAGEAYLAALDEADEYARAARLLTLETAADHRLFRRWYVEALILQLRARAAGRDPQPIAPFQEVLVAEVRRLAAAQRVSERAARLQQVTAALATARTPEDVAAVVVSEGMSVLGASGGGLLVPAGDGVHVAVPGAVGYDTALVDAIREERLDAPLPAATVIRTGEPVWLESQEERDREFPALRGFERDTISMCAVPLAVGSRLLGALRFSFSARRLFDDDERAFVLALAAQTAQTLQRTEMHEAERQAALELQRALLPEGTPSVAGWDIASYYSPAGGQEAGGDFYDVLQLSNEALVAVVGDVMGRGVSAAAAMAQVRSTIRAYAIDNPDPQSVMRRLDTFFGALDVSQLVTALYFVVDVETGVARIVSAGHLPPLLVDGARVVRVEADAGTPLGVEGGGRETTSVTIPHGGSLVAITDGVVERRGEDIDLGIRKVVEACARANDSDAASLLRQVVGAVGADGEQDDDVTALVIRRAEGPAGETTVPARSRPD